LANGLTDLEPIHAGKHHVEDYQIEVFAQNSSLRVAAIRGAFNVIPFAAQHVGEGNDECGFIFNQENTSHQASWPAAIAGRCRVNRVPSVTELETVTLPPSDSTMDFTM